MALSLVRLLRGGVTPLLVHQEEGGLLVGAPAVLLLQPAVAQAVEGGGQLLQCHPRAVPVLFFLPRSSAALIVRNSSSTWHSIRCRIIPL